MNGRFRLIPHESARLQRTSASLIGCLGQARFPSSM
jgi:hypothetical protein